MGPGRKKSDPKLANGCYVYIQNLQLHLPGKLKKMDRPRRSTRNSLYNSTPTTTTTPSTSSTSNQNNNNSNPYKKPTYLAGRSSEAGSTPTSRSGRGRGRGRSSAGGRHSNHDNGSTPLSGNGGSKSGKSSRPECVATRVESRRSTGGSSGGGGGGASSNKKKR